MSIPGQSGGGEFELFTFRRIPVALSPFFFLLVLIVFWRDRNPVTAGLTVAVFAASVLLHEFGHGFMAKRYGLRPSIVLHAFGGWCAHRPAPNRRKAFFVSAAGPAATLVLAAVAWVLFEIVQFRAGPLVAHVLWMTASLNAFLAVLNLLPILPMDGGTLAQHALAWFLPQRRADGIAHWVGAVLAGLLCVWGLSSGSLFIGILFGMFAYQNATQAQSFDLKASFWPARRGTPANRSGLDYPVPQGIWILAAATSVSFLSASALGTPSEVASLALYADPIRTGVWHPVITHLFVYRPWDWGPLLFTLFALGGLGPVVHRRVGPIGFGAIWFVAAALGVAAAVAPVPEVEGFAAEALTARPVYGAVAPNAALLVAWAFVAPKRPAFFTPLKPLPLAALVFVGGLAAAVFATDWAWRPAVAGAFAGILVWIPWPGLRKT